MVMTKNKLVIVGLLGILAVLALFRLSPADKMTQRPAIRAAVQNPINHTILKIDYTDGGFRQSTLNVPVNTTIQWVNKSQREMWIAAFPGFDQLKEGDSYFYTFTEVGSFKYHNNLNPGHTGVVNVGE